MYKMALLIAMIFFGNITNADQLTDQMSAFEAAEQQNAIAARDLAKVQADYANQKNDLKQEVPRTIKPNVSEINTKTAQKPTSLPKLSNATVSDSNGLELKTIIVEGVGSDVESAMKNAAENALMQVVGTFIDAQKQLDKRTEIINGIRNETKNLSSSTKEYSQGTIKSFNILDSNQEGVLIRVNAKVEVRIDDFHAYIKKLAEGEVGIDKGLFVKMATEQKQQSNLSSILFNDVISPVMKGSVLEFKIGEPKLASEIQDFNFRQHADYLISKSGSTNVVVIKVEVSLNQEFTENLYKTVESVSTKKTTFNTGYSGIGMSFHQSTQGILSLGGYDYINDTILLFHHGKFNQPFRDAYNRPSIPTNLMDAYLFKGSQRELTSKLSTIMEDRNLSIPSNNIEILLLGSSDQILQKELTGNLT